MKAEALSLQAAVPPRDENRAWRRFRKHRMAMVGLILLIGLILFVVIGSALIPYERATVPNVRNRLQAPSERALFGTDQLGQDVLARAIYGGQLSLLIGTSAMLLSILIGTLIGAIAGYYGGVVDNLLMRFTEAVMTIPRLFLLLVLAKYFGGRMPSLPFFGRELSGGVLVVVIVIGITSWTSLARIVRAQILSLKNMEFVTAAESLGVPRRRILWRHLLPNTLASIIVSATLGIAGAILSESYVSFLGLGVDAKTPTWGNMMQMGYRYISTAPWMWIFPGVLIVISVLCINFIGDGLRDALDPRSQKG
ncbi:MAG: peptide ABC transporter permease [Candidatus Thermofonsia Clade 1 bacterium]|uniref:Peptide ABC transporter permease n=1 Tax=Candidatus Thermofonsia Clade 1 bacterium TaxID=2364210 RepID=A0A2M8NYZ8_9CHLR|nr:MAG: peptide ABC transporter permease [Candidatus Thermofonsia Clade 1 bacterium]